MAEKDKAQKGGKPQGGAQAKGEKKAAAAPKEARVATPRPKDYKPRLKSHYEKVVRDALMQKFGYANVMQIPKIEKVVLNMGVGDAVNDRKKVDNAVAELALIAGQRPVVTRARKAIATYKLREGMAIGAKVTLRGDRMYEFLDRLISIGLPRTRDFRGVKVKGFDGRGNFTFGVKEQIIFPEINLDKIKNVTGMDITFVTSANTDEEAKALLSGFGFPFVKN